MTEEITKIKVDNFKSLKDFEMPLGKFNVLIGPNGSGKTNVLEFFSLMGSCLASQKTPVYPFTYWGRYKNLVWSGNEHESIRAHIKYTIDGHDVTYDSTITSSNNGRLEILEERLHIEDYLTVMLQDDKIKFSLDAYFVNTTKSIIEEKKHRLEDIPYERLIKGFNSGKSFTMPHTSRDISILRTTGWMHMPLINNIMSLRTFRQTHDDIQVYQFLSPMIREGDAYTSLYRLTTKYLTNTSNIILLRHMDYDNLRQSIPIDYSTELSEDGDGLINLLFQWFNKDQKFPDIIMLALETLFPGWQISFHVTHEANIIMEVRDGKVILAPTSIPDGFYKLLAILVAVELNPRILLIDEIETSLHARIIEYVIGILKNTESTVIITTHSPLVVDSVDIDDLILMENTRHKSTCRKIENPDGLKQELADKGIAISDSWLYGEL